MGRESNCIIDLGDFNGIYWRAGRQAESPGVWAGSSWCLHVPALTLELFQSQHTGSLQLMNHTTPEFPILFTSVVENELLAWQPLSPAPSLNACAGSGCAAFGWQSSSGCVS